MKSFEKSFFLAKLVSGLTVFVLFQASCSNNCEPPQTVAAYCREYELENLEMHIKSKSWNRVEEYARRFTSLFASRRDDSDISKGYADLSMALRHLNRLDEAYVAANKGIITANTEPEPHLEKALVLITQNRYQEGLHELRLTENLANKKLIALDKIPVEQKLQSEKIYKIREQHYRDILITVNNHKKTYGLKR